MAIALGFYTSQCQLVMQFWCQGKSVAEYKTASEHTLVSAAIVFIYHPALNGQIDDFSGEHLKMSDNLPQFPQ